MTLLENPSDFLFLTYQDKDLSVSKDDFKSLQRL